MLTASLPAEPPLLSLAIRYAVAALLLLPWALRSRCWRLPLRSIGGAVLVGAGLLAIPQILIVMAGRGIGAGWSLLALAAVPILLAIGGHGAISTAVCGFAGVVFLIAGNLEITLSQTPWLLCPLVAAVVLAWTLAHAGQLLQQITISSALCVQCVVAAALTAVAAAFFERAPIVWSISVGAGLVGAALIATVGGYFVFYWLLPQLGPVRLSMLQWFQLLLAAAESALLSHARPGWDSALGALLVCLGIYLAFAYPEADQGVMFKITEAP